MRRFSAIALTLLFSASALAQPGGDDRSRRDRGDRGDRGSMSGGFGGDRFGGGFGGDRPSFGSFGGDRSSFGSDRGGFSPWGGGFSSGGFSGSGMADMVRRFDRNQNNMIDPEEAQGPASFFLQRIAQNNSRIDLTKPIPVDTIVSEFERMRSGRSDSSSSGSSSTSTHKDEPKLLVPDFRTSEKPIAVPGFGVEPEKPPVQVTERDKAEAEERVRRYDKNNDKVLSADELAQSRYSPEEVAQYDRNHDGKLTIDELAVRQAMRRLGDQSNSQSNQPQSSSSGSSGWGSGSSNGWSRGGSDRDRGSDRNSDSRSSSKKEEEKRFGDSKSYKTNSTPSASGLPSFFTSADLNSDGQVTLAEFAGSLNESTINEFNQWDLNSDGMITIRECQAADKAGVRVGGAKSGKSSTSVSSVGSKSSSLKGPSASSGKVTEADLEAARKTISKYDGDKDGKLSKTEASKMLTPPPPSADSNGDGSISDEEFAAYRAK